MMNNNNYHTESAETIRKEIANEMSKRFPMLSINLRDVSKLQGKSYIGISFCPSNSKKDTAVVGGVLNIDNLVEAVQNCMPMKTAFNYVEKQISETVENMPAFNVNTIMDYEQIKDKLHLQLIPVAGNEEKLATVPHKTINEEMAVVYRAMLDEHEDSSSSFLISNEMLHTYGVSEESLHEDALHSSIKNYPSTFVNMNDMMREFMENDYDVEPFVSEEPHPMWIASIEGK